MHTVRLVLLLRAGTALVLLGAAFLLILAHPVHVGADNVSYGYCTGE